METVIESMQSLGMDKFRVAFTRFLAFYSDNPSGLNAPINGLPQDGGAGQPTGIRLRKAHVGRDFDIHNGPQGGKFDSTAILKSGEDLGMSEWSAILENYIRSHLSEFPASKVRSTVLLFLK